MPKKITELVAFISCPSDLMAERRIFDAAIEELNPILKDSYSIVLRSIGWEDNVVPGIGSDPQAVINSQIEGRYDIYIGLIGSRLGTETPRAASGTEEEFRAACLRYGKRPQSVRVIFYFKSTIDNAHALDLDQFSRVRAFRKSLGSSGVLYHDFSNPDELLKLAKNHLRQLVAEQWAGNDWKVLSPRYDQDLGASVADTFGVDSIPYVEHPGVLDILVSGQEELQIALGSLVNVKVANDRLAESMQKHQGEMSAASEPRALKSILDEISTDFTNYIAELKKEGINFKSSFAQYLNAIEAGIKYCSDNREGLDELRGAPKEIADLIASMHQARENLSLFRQILGRIPSVISTVSEIKRKSETTFAEWRATLTVFLDRAETIKNDLEKLLAG
jgi:hypothetical protein